MYWSVFPIAVAALFKVVATSPQNVSSGKHYGGCFSCGISIEVCLALVTQSAAKNLAIGRMLVSVCFSAQLYPAERSLCYFVNSSSSKPSPHHQALSVVKYNRSEDWGREEKHSQNIRNSFFAQNKICKKFNISACAG